MYKMLSYKKSKSQKRSQSQSKSGGRRRKQTTKKYRRGKKVMRGGTTSYVMNLSSKSENLYNIIRDDNSITDKTKLLDFLNSSKYKYWVNRWYKDLFDKEPEPNLNPEDVKNEIITKLEQGDYKN